METDPFIWSQVFYSDPKLPIGYARGEAPLGSIEPPEERTIEYEEEALRHFEGDL
jgi:hypothetical protein